SYFFLLCQRWNVSPALQICGALLIAAHPAAFFLIAGYSESLFLIALLGFIYWSTTEGWAAKFWAGVHGIVMSATRIVGIVCAAFPIVRSIFQSGWRGLVEAPKRFREYSSAIGMTVVAACGGIAFFVYSQLRWATGTFIRLHRQPGGGLSPIIWRCLSSAV